MRPYHLIAYREMIKGFNIAYGEKCWPLLYQQDVRFRQEVLPEILHKETKKLDASMTDGSWKKGVGLDTDRPWNHCFALLHTPEVKVWWRENFKDLAVLITVGARTVSQYLAGDANISSSSGSHHPSSGNDAAPDGNSAKRAKMAEHSKPGKDNRLKELQACNGFNKGHCQGEAGKVCPKSGRFCHKCSQCGSFKRGVMDCPQSSKKVIGKDKATQGAPWKTKNGKGGGKKGGRSEW